MKKTRGSHHQFAKKGTKNIVTVPTNRKDLPIGTLKSISIQLGVIFK